MMKQPFEGKGKEQKDNEEYSKNFARIPNMLFTSFKYLTKEEKYLYCTLKCIYWDAKPRFVSLRELSDMTGYSRGALGNMLPRLHDCGLINAEIRKEKNHKGIEYGNPKYNITILDIWELNRQYHSCPLDGRDSLDPSLILVHEKSQPCPPDGQACPPNVPKSSTKRAKVGTSNGQDHAQAEHAKDSKDPLKTSLKKEERTLVPPSVQPSSSLIEWIKQEKVICPKDRAKVQEYIQQLVPITSKEQMHRLKEFALSQIRGNDKRVFLGNLAGSLDAFLQAERAMQAFAPAHESTPPETASQSEIEALAAEIAACYPELVIRTGEDDYGLYIDVVYGGDENDCWPIRSVEEWEHPGAWEQKSLAQAREYGKAHCLTTIAG